MSLWDTNVVHTHHQASVILYMHHPTRTINTVLINSDLTYNQNTVLTCMTHFPHHLIHGSQPEYYLKTHLAGDIHPNPGPVRNPCGVCYRRKMTCDGCFFDFQIKCGNVSPMEYNIYNQSENKQWNCNLCTDPFCILR